MCRLASEPFSDHSLNTAIFPFLLCSLSLLNFYTCHLLTVFPPHLGASLVAHLVKKNLPAMQETQVWSLRREDPLEEGLATHSSILSWRILWTEDPGRLQSMGSQSRTRLCDFRFTSPREFQEERNFVCFILCFLLPGRCSINNFDEWGGPAVSVTQKGPASPSRSPGLQTLTSNSSPLTTMEEATLDWSDPSTLHLLLQPSNFFYTPYLCPILHCPLSSLSAS